MASQLRNSVLRAAMSVAAAPPMTDRELLDKFRNGDESAFAAIVKRHSALVLGVCRRVLPIEQDAEDACQATFLVLMRKAKTGRWQSSIANWLHITARRIALSVNRSAARRTKRETSAKPIAPFSALDEISGREAFAAIDEELARLPALYGEPLVMCYLQELGREEAAARLGIPILTLKSRLERGRKKLAAALARRGIDVGAGLIAVAATSATGASSSKFVESILTAAGGSPSATVSAIAKGVVMKSALFKVKVLAFVVLAGAALTALGLARGPKESPAAKAPTPIDPKENRETSSFTDPDNVPLPEGALARIGSTRMRHDGPVKGLRYSPSGKWLASISLDATARLWDAATGRQVLSVPIKDVIDLPAFEGMPSSQLGFSKDGKQFFVVDGDSLRAFDIDTGKEVFSRPHGFPPKQKAPKKRPALLASALISPDGQCYVLSRRGRGQGPDANLLEIRDVATGNVAATAKGVFQDLSFYAIQFSPDGRHLAVTPGPDGNGFQLAFVEVATGKTIGRVEGDGEFRSMRFVPGADKVVVVNDKVELKNGRPFIGKKVAELFDWKSGKLLASVELANSTLDAAVLEVSPDGKTFAARMRQELFVQIVAIETGKEIARLPTPWELATLAFSPDGKLLAGALRDTDSIVVWDLKTHAYHSTVAQPISCLDVRFGPESNCLIIPEWGRPQLGRPLVDWRTGKVLERLMEEPVRVEGGTFRHIVLSPSGRWFAIGDPKDHSIRVVDAKTGKQFRSFQVDSDFISDLSFSLDEFRLAAVARDQTVRGRSLSTGNEIAEFTTQEFPGGQVSLSADGRIMALGGWNPLIYVWDVDAKKQLARIEDKTKGFMSAVLSPDGKWIAAVGAEERRQADAETAVYIWAATTGQLVRTLPGHAVPGRGRAPFLKAASCAFSPDSRWLATGDVSGKLRLWEVLTGEEAHAFVGHRDHVKAEFSPDGKLLVAASDDAPCFVWDVFNVAPAAKQASADELRTSWTALEEADAKRAYAAIRRLAANPGPSVELIGSKLKPAAAIDSKIVEGLFRDLVSDKFKERDRASAELSRIVDRIEPALRERLETTKSADEHERLEQILKPAGTPSTRRIQEGRIMTLLEVIATPQALKLLDSLAAGAKDDSLTRGAADAAKRLRKRGVK